MLEQHNKTDGLPVWTYLSWSRLSGYLDPGGNNGFSSVVLVLAAIGSDLEGLDEFPALPDLTIPRLGGIFHDITIADFDFGLYHRPDTYTNRL